MSSPAELVQAVRDDGDFDATDAQALRWLDGRHKMLCQRGKWLRQSFTIELVALQDTYALPAAVSEVIAVLQGNLAYSPARSEDFAALLSSQAILVGSGGVYGEGVSDTGDAVLRIAPVPTEEGELVLTGLVLPPNLELEGAASTVKIPADLEPALIAGAVAEGLATGESRPDLARLNEERFDRACDELARRANKRYQAQGPVRVRFARAVG